MRSRKTIAPNSMGKKIMKLSAAFCLPVAVALVLVSCYRRPMDDAAPPAVARIPVHIDWSKSGIDLAAGDEANHVHRVSIRFYPQDGSPIFDRFLEEPNVTDGVIDVPIGKYKIIVYNESVDDIAWWNGAITFTDADNYDNFAAHAVPLDPASQASGFPFFRPGPTDNTILGGPDPRKLASWNLDLFEVTPNMVLVSNGWAPVAHRTTTTRTAYEDQMMNALTDIVMRRLTYNVTVTATIQNLVATQDNYCYVAGFANTVYMASTLTTYTPSTKLMKLNGRKYTPPGDPNAKDGTTTHSFLSFGRTPAPKGSRETPHS